MTSVTCSVCVQRIVADSDRIDCFGGCEQILHVRCSDLTTAAVNAIRDNVALKYMCFDCREKQICLNDINNTCRALMLKVNELSDLVVKCDSTIQNLTAGLSDRLIGSVLSQVQSSIKETIAAEAAVLKSIFTATNSSTNVEIGISSDSIVKPTYADAVHSSTVSFNVTKRKANGISAVDIDDCSVLRSGKRRRMGNHKTTKNINALTDDVCITPLSSIPLNSPIAPTAHGNATVTKNSTVVRLEQTVVFKPKTAQPVSATRKDISEKLDPLIYGTNGMQHRENGEIAVRCGSTELANFKASERRKHFIFGQISY
ncbi:uncharacterized protein LOC129717610 [Wyeomyia smithii]|uniref:uncharacterized protein LOC129717610 n=1 Tax=Wyeomyia smithii TaxID=174621 RepID=UPI002467C60E|nr:uncharacterized protein LOC129717610 [Wyeomyia smithii]XP_055523614.1 uncharacterized protein LOC129717610 [Wyeomyia smithii]